MSLRYTFVRFTPRRKEKVIDLLSSLSLQTRTLLSLSGVDPKAIYLGFRDNWKDDLATVLLEDNKAIAIGKLNLRGRKAYLSCLVVKEDHQRKGFGSRLVKYLFSCAMFAGSKIIETEVRKENSVALDFFKKLRFVVTKKNEYTYSLERTL